MVSKNSSTSQFTVPGMMLKDGHEVAAILQERLNALNDLQLTLKHAHWNVVGRDFIGVHEMLDETAERIATLGVSPNGLPGALVRDRDWDDYSIGRASTTEHLAAIDVVYDGVVSSHRDASGATGELDPITEDMLIGQSAKLELFQWFMRAHLEDNDGILAYEHASTEKTAASSVEK